MRAILFLVLVCACLRHAAGAESVFDGSLREGWRVGAWGGSSRADPAAGAAEDGGYAGRIELAGDGSYSGAFITGSPCMGLSAASGLRLLTFRVRGEKGGEALTVMLRDGMERDGADGYQSSVSITDFVAVTADWQDVAIPLSGFPRTGMNWTLPPLDQIPHRQEIDWKRINMVGLNRTAAPVTFHVTEVAFVAAPAGLDRPALAAPRGAWAPLADSAPSWRMTRMYGVHSLLLAEGIDLALQGEIREQALAHFAPMVFAAGYFALVSTAP